MPSPFPGMDPYLEGDLWTPFQSLFACEIVLQLSPLLRPAFVALPDKRYYSAGSRGGDPIPHAFAVIRKPMLGAIVTWIEIISPASKKAEGREAYSARRNDYLRAPTHLLEIDLTGEPPSWPSNERMPSAPHCVILSRANKRPVVEMWPIQWEHRLPTVPVPLGDGDADAVLDLQAALNRLFEKFALDLSIDYAAPPEVPLPSDKQQWVDSVLRAAGKRT
jgi:hypothetical protein